eukprot:6434798-Pyramimonas_sp.AAC.1
MAEITELAAISGRERTTRRTCEPLQGTVSAIFANSGGSHTCAAWLTASSARTLHAAMLSASPPPRCFACR